MASIFEFYADKIDGDIDVERCMNSAIDAIQPSRSHTFRKGGSGGWRGEFDHSIKDLFKEVSGDLLIRSGYEKSNDW